MATGAAPLDGRPRPNLQPIWTTHYNLGGFPRSGIRPGRPSPLYTPSPRSPKSVASLPAPVYPSGTTDMRQHERSMLERFDSRLRQAQNTDSYQPRSSTHSRALTAIELSTNERRFSSSTSLSSPRYGSRLGVPPPTPASPATTFPRRQTIVAETRSMLLSAMPTESGSRVSELRQQIDRRQSAPSLGVAMAKKVAQTHHLEQLRAWGHIHFGNATTADVFVQAVALRRPSDSSSSSGHSNADEEAPRKSFITPSAPSNHTTIRARVRPRALERRPFLLQRNFNMEELRGTVPEPLPNLTALDAARRRSSIAGLPNSRASHSQLGHMRRCSSSAIHGMHPIGRSLRSRSSASFMHDANAVPIHLEYARSHIPVLAALIVSGHVREGDIIDLPLPQPAAWYQTVAYVYTGQGEVTDAVKENIRYLAGKI